MRKLYVSFLLCLSTVVQSHACGWGPEEDYSYYNLFIQEIINNPHYYPFLLTLDNHYYSSKEKGKNENIEQWQSYLDLNYEDTEYLVFKASKAAIDSLIKKQTVANKRLRFATASWTSKHHQALLYLSYAKYLEPYMRIVPDREWVYGYGYESYAYGYYSNHAADLDYEKVMNVLQRSWAAETDNELKLRYGYQMVRLAHYTCRYAEAADFFEHYVESLNYRPAMYYYALNQRAGAERGLGNTFRANHMFFTVFANTKNLKENALNSICLTSDVDFNQLILWAESENEINDAYLLLGYMSFSNPIAMAEKIAEKSPDAIQLKVLIARAINELERKYLSEHNTMLLSESSSSASLAENDEFFAQALDFLLRMADNKQVEEKDFWNLTAAYLCFLNKDFTEAKSYLAKVDDKNTTYKNQKKDFTDYIYICEQSSITPAVEKVLFEKYQKLISIGGKEIFLTDLLANRYFLQKDYAKSFLISNAVSDLEAYFTPDLLTQIEAFLSKPNKNEWEKYIVQSASKHSQTDLQQYISYLWGNYYLAKGELHESLAAFAKVSPSFKWTSAKLKDDYQGFTGISNKIFGYNQIECFDCPAEKVMKNDFSAQFPVIKKTMNKKELVEALIQLQKIGEQNNEKSAEANYLLGNFFYNVSITGYYRHVLRFDQTNGANWSKFSLWQNNSPKDIYSGVYFKNYWQFMYYDNQTDIATDYLKKAYEQANDKELKAHIAFALSKCEQVNWDMQSSPYDYWNQREDILISDRTYFAELAKYKGTRFYDEVNTHCKYFAYYVNHVAK